MTISQSRFATQERRLKIARLYLQKKMQSEIAREVGVSQPQVHYDIKAIQASWLEHSLLDFDALKSEQLALLDELQRVAWEGWERSVHPHEVTITEMTEGGEERGTEGAARPTAPKRKVSLRKEGQAGDPRFLERIQKCIDQRCAILGLGEEQKALKAASLGLAALLEQARQGQGHSAPAAPRIAEA